LLIALMFMPGYLGFGARKLWAGAPKLGEPSFYGIKVEPGSETMRRRTDLSVVATLRGFTAPQVRLMAKYDSAAKWEEMPMTPRTGEASYGYLISAVPEGMQYYVEAAGVKSETYQIKVVDLPGVKNIKVTYRYPAWMHKEAFVEDPGGDLRAVTGTTAELTVETDKPLSGGLIVLQDGTEIAMSEPSTSGTGTKDAKSYNTVRVPILKDGAYHFAAKLSGEVVRLTSDYFIEALEDQGPKVTIKNPGADAQANPIQEVVVNIQATDDYGVEKLQLHYSVNGEAEKTVNLTAKGTPMADGSVTLSLEDFKMVPGDVITMYATAKDARVEASSDVVFVQAMAFEKNYSQSQQEGGGGGGGGQGKGKGGEQDQPNAISRRQRDLISLTNKAIRGSEAEKAAANKERAEFMAERQTTLQAQAESLAQRVEARQLDDESSAIKEMVKEIRAAAEAMGPAAKDLTGMNWEKAMVSERAALTHLQRAEEINRDIQVAFGNQGQQGGGGGGGGQNAGRDLANLFDLELDTEKNQYEQAQSARQQGGGGEGGEQQQQVDDAMKKLEELARRAQAAAEQSKQQQGKQQQTVDRRWDQEQLRRDIEELKKEIEQLQQQMAQQQGQQKGGQQKGGQQKGGQQGQQSGQQGGEGGQQSAQQQQQQLQQLQQQLERAQQNIRDAQAAANQGKQGEANAAQQRAAEALNQANQQAAQAQQQGTAAALEQLEKKTENLAERSRRAENQMKQAAQAPGDIPRPQREEMGDEREQRRQEFAELQRDMNRQSQQLRQQSPEAARELRDALAAAEEKQMDLRLEYSEEYIRNRSQSQLQQWLPNEALIGRTLEEMAQSVRDARSKLGSGQQAGQKQDQDERTLAALANARESLERALEEARRQNAQNGQDGQGKQGGQGKDGQGKQGGQGQGKDGQGKDGQGKDGQQAQGGGQGKDGQGKGQGGGQGKDGQQQASGQGKDGQGKGKGEGQGKGGEGQGGGQGQGNSQQAGGQQPGQGGQQGGNQQGFGGGPIGGNYGGGYDRYGRYYPEGVYDRAGLPPVDPSQTARDLNRDLATIAQANRGNREITTQVQDLQRELQNLAVGNPSGPELENRLSRAILPKLESLEVQLRQEIDKEKGGQARSAATDRTPAGFAEGVAEYYRRLGRAK
jgi:hypothetical protein